MFKIKLVTIAILVGGVVLGALSYLTPMPHLTDAMLRVVDESTYHSTLAFLITSTVYGFGGGLLFLFGLAGFSKAFRRTYYDICAGFIIQGLGSLYYVYASFAGTFKGDHFSVIVEIPLMVGIIAVYIGFLRYARLLQIQSLLTRPLFVAISFILLMIIVWFLPHRTDGDPRNELLFDIAHVMQVVELMMYLVTATVASQIRNNTGPRYARSMWWLKWGLVTSFPATLVLFGQDYIKLYSWIDAGGMSLLFIVTNIFTIFSAYAFNKIARLPVAQQTYNNSLLDSVIFLGSLASNPSEVDPILDKVRLVTAEHTPGALLSASETRELKIAYTELEEYLTTRERARTFDRKDLTELVQERFNWTLAP